MFQIFALGNAQSVFIATFLMPRCSIWTDNELLTAVGTVFIQILHDGDRHHWLTVSNLDYDQPDTVFVYDSLFSSSSSSVRAQVACLLQAKSPIALF